MRLFESLPRHPIVTESFAMKLLEISKPTADRAIEVLVAAGVITEARGQKRDRAFVYHDYMKRLRDGTDFCRM